MPSPCLVIGAAASPGKGDFWDLASGPERLSLWSSKGGRMPKRAEAQGAIATEQSFLPSARSRPCSGERAGPGWPSGVSRGLPDWVWPQAGLEGRMKFYSPLFWVTECRPNRQTRGGLR